MPLDPQAQRVIEQMAALDLPPVNTVSPQQARINRKARPMAPGPEVGKVDNRLIPGLDTEIPVRIYTPEGSGPFPTLVWFHGGGWVVGDLDTVDATARRLTVGVGCVVTPITLLLSRLRGRPGRRICWENRQTWDRTDLTYSSRPSESHPTVAYQRDSRGI